MEFVYILLAIGAVLLIYQLVLRRDDDVLDKRGRPKRKGKF
jgi:hypothetical protein